MDIPRRHLFQDWVEQEQTAKVTEEGEMVKKNKKHPNWKRRNKTTNTIHRWHDLIHRKSYGLYTETIRDNNHVNKVTRSTYQNYLYLYTLTNNPKVNFKKKSRYRTLPVPQKIFSCQSPPQASSVLILLNYQLALPIVELPIIRSKNIYPFK